MMKIQVIRYSASIGDDSEKIFYSPLTKPRALDDFDVNVIDLSIGSMWQYQTSASVGRVDCDDDLLTVQNMVANKKRAIVIYVLPQNINYKYNISSAHNKKSVPIKNKLSEIYSFTIMHIIAPKSAMPTFAFENTRTTIAGKEFEADFYFNSDCDTITKSNLSEKPTSVMIAKGVFVTTLNIAESAETLLHYITALFVKQEHEDAPEWLKDISFADDEQQNRQIEQGQAEILAAQAKIEAAESKLAENARYKSILYTNGDELVGVVFDILEQILACDLSSFVDDKKEDFLIKLPSGTFIGEIKGVTSNVKYEHISQVELHYRGYLDRLAESGISESVKQLLIMNPFRTKALDKRDPVHISQIELAIRNGCLIIETNTLLRLYEKFCNGEVTVQKCVDVLSSKTGLLCLNDFDAGDIEPYKV